MEKTKGLKPTSYKACFPDALIISRTEWATIKRKITCRTYYFTL